MTKKEDIKEIPLINTNEPKYAKDNIVKSNYYKQHRDLLNALLEDNKSYTKSEIQIIIDGYLKKKVN